MPNLSFKKRSGEDYPSMGSIGGKIKRIREHLGLSQKQVGVRCGYPESSADVRIRQYESNQKIPRQDAMEKLCSALNIDEDSLFDADLNKKTRAYHALFDMEDFHGLHPVKVNGKYYLEFSGQDITGRDIQRFENNDFLKQWAEAREKYSPKPEDDDETKKEKRKEYDIWRYQYPRNDYFEKFKDL